ncbi:MAG: sigma-70 family RNA polymerase sigma factor [Firmicutes bacterium]|nr:sigma-70 family RNA polymerase sigma factor [Bacillota bacterium]
MSSSTEVIRMMGKAGDNPLEEAICRHTGLVRSVALRLSRAYGEELEDVMQIGFIGLIKAVQRFEPERGLQFSTYAVPVIAGEIRAQLRDQGPVKMSRNLKADAAAVKRAETDYMMSAGRSPKLSELAEITGMTLERVSEALTAADALKNLEEYENANIWTDNEQQHIAGIDLRSSIRDLPDRERNIIVLRYYRDLTQQQVAKIMGISQVQVCRIEKNILKELAEKV